MKELDDLKKDVRKLKTLQNTIRIHLDSGNVDHLYEDLDKAQEIVGTFNRSLRELGKTLDKHQKV